MTMKCATSLLLGLSLSALSACNSHRSRPADYARARVPQLTASLFSDQADVRCQAAFGLGRIARHAADAVPALRCSLSDPSPEVRDMARWALCRICAVNGDPPASITPEPSVAGTPGPGRPKPSGDPRRRSP